MRLVLISAVAFLVAACSIKTASDDNGASAADSVKASGSLSGSVVGTITNADVAAVSTNGAFSLSIAPDADNSLVLTTPAESTLEDTVVLEALFQFNATPTVGTAYTIANAGAMFAADLEFTSADMTTSYSYAAGTLSTTPSSTSLTVTFTSVSVASSSGSTDIYTTHGTVAATMLGGAINGTSGSTPGSTNLQLTF